MSVRSITKALAGIQDLLLGNEEHVQLRGNQEVTVKGLSAESLPLTAATGPTVGDLVKYGNNSPEGVVEAIIGASYHDLIGGKLYVKESAPTTSTGWVQK